MKKGMVVLIAWLLFMGGCAAPRHAVVEEQTAQTATPQDEGSNMIFYTFPDIPVPKELTLQRGKSFIYETPNVKAGVLVLSGNVDIDSLENYFKVNMVKNGWRFVNSYKYGTTILNFIKEDRASNIRATKESFTTRVEIWVGPVDKAAPAPHNSKENGFR
jgi:PBP1b-binding outer membrane lipoprotein LpoB